MISLILTLFGAAILLALAGAALSILWNLPRLLLYTLTDALKQPRAAANDAKPPVESIRNRIAIALLLFAILVALPVIVVATATQYETTGP